MKNIVCILLATVIGVACQNVKPPEDQNYIENNLCNVLDLQSKVRDKCCFSLCRDTTYPELAYKRCTARYLEQEYSCNSVEQSVIMAGSHLCRCK